MRHLHCPRPLVGLQTLKDRVSDNEGNKNDAEVMFDWIALLHLQQGGRKAIS